MFLVENPAEVQRAWQIFAAEDGGLPADDDYEAMDKVYPWVNCPVLTALDTDQETLGSLYIGRRGFYEDQGEGREADEAVVPHGFSGKAQASRAFWMPFGCQTSRCGTVFGFVLPCGTYTGHCTFLFRQQADLSVR